MVRNVLLLVHIAAVAAWLGANAVQFVVGPRMRRRGPAVAAAWSDTALFLGRRYYNVAGAVVALSGVGLVLHGHWGWHGFVLVGIAAVAIGAGLGILAFEPRLRRELAAIESGDEVGARRLQHDITSIAVLDTAVVLVTMLAMIDRWMA